MPTSYPEPVDLTKILEPYEGEWVALSSDQKRVMGHGPTPHDALEMAKEKGEKDPILFGVPDAYSSHFL